MNSKLLSPKVAFNKYGIPSLNNRNLILFDVPSNLEIGVIPKRIYCNKDLVLPLTKGFTNLIERNFVNELKTWDGCFNIRLQRGSKSLQSLHSWGLAIDVNAFENGLNQKPKLSFGFVNCFLDAGFNWGGYFQRPDGMHFELKG